MRVDVDESRCHDGPACVEFLFALGPQVLAHLGDLAVANTDVTTSCRGTGPVNDCPTANQQIAHVLRLPVSVRVYSVSHRCKGLTNPEWLSG